MSAGNRRAALETLLEVTERGAYANLALKKALEGREARDAAWITAAVYTALDHLAYLDYIIDRFAKGRMDAKIRGILRLGLCQAEYMNVPERAACDESVRLTKEIGKGALAGYVNGVLRGIFRGRADWPALPQEPVERLCLQYGWPRFVTEEYVASYGVAFTEAMFACEQRGMTLRAQRPYTQQELERELAARGVAFSRGTLVPEAIKLHAGLGGQIAEEPLFAEGRIAVQSESAMLVCRALGARPGMRVLDACAAPGGKTAYLSHLMQGAGEILAFEVHPHRVELTRKTLARLHVENAEVRLWDACAPLPELYGSFDAVLVDAPCSGLGVPGKPDARYAKTDASIEALAALQARILDACAAYVKPGGTLLYATCTVSARENEMQARAFLARHAEFSRGALRGVLPEALWVRAEGGMLQLFPHLDQTEGFFLAKFQRNV